MQTKTLEIRDEGTCIPVLAIRMLPDSEASRYWLHRCGYPEDGRSITVMCLNDGKATNDPYEWTALGMGPRTMPVAHSFVIDHFDELEDGAIVDVQVILRERREPKASERFTVPLA